MAETPIHPPEAAKDPLQSITEEMLKDFRIYLARQNNLTDVARIQAEELFQKVIEEEKQKISEALAKKGRLSRVINTLNPFFHLRAKAKLAYWTTTEAFKVAALTKRIEAEFARHGTTALHNIEAVLEKKTTTLNVQEFAARHAEERALAGRVEALHEAKEAGLDTGEEAVSKAEGAVQEAVIKNVLLPTVVMLSEGKEPHEVNKFIQEKLHATLDHTNRHEALKLLGAGAHGLGLYSSNILDQAHTMAQNPALVAAIKTNPEEFYEKYARNIQLIAGKNLDTKLKASRGTLATDVAGERGRAPYPTKLLNAFARPWSAGPLTAWAATYFQPGTVASDTLQRLGEFGIRTFGKAHIPLAIGGGALTTGLVQGLRRYSDTKKDFRRAQEEVEIGKDYQGKLSEFLTDKDKRVAASKLVEEVNAKIQQALHTQDPQEKKRLYAQIYLSIAEREQRTGIHITYDNQVQLGKTRLLQAKVLALKELKNLGVDIKTIRGEHSQLMSLAGGEEFIKSLNIDDTVEKKLKNFRSFNLKESVKAGVTAGAIAGTIGLVFWGADRFIPDNIFSLIADRVRHWVLPGVRNVLQGSTVGIITNEQLKHLQTLVILGGQKLQDGAGRELNNLPGVKEIIMPTPDPVPNAPHLPGVRALEGVPNSPQPPANLPGVKSIQDTLQKGVETPALKPTIGVKSIEGAPVFTTTPAPSPQFAPQAKPTEVLPIPFLEDKEPPRAAPLPPQPQPATEVAGHGGKLVAKELTTNEYLNYLQQKGVEVDTPQRAGWIDHGTRTPDFGELKFFYRMEKDGDFVMDIKGTVPGANFDKFQIWITLNEDAKEKIILDVRPDGKVVIPKDHPLYSLFVKDGKITSIPRYVEAVRPDNYVVSTVVGEGSKETFTGYTREPAKIPLPQEAPKPFVPSPQGLGEEGVYDVGNFHTGIAQLFRKYYGGPTQKVISGPTTPLPPLMREIFPPPTAPQLPPQTPAPAPQEQTAPLIPVKKEDVKKTIEDHYYAYRTKTGNPLTALSELEKSPEIQDLVNQNPQILDAIIPTLTKELTQERKKNPDPFRKARQNFYLQAMTTQNLRGEALKDFIRNNPWQITFGKKTIISDVIPEHTLDAYLKKLYTQHFGPNIGQQEYEKDFPPAPQLPETTPADLHPIDELLQQGGRELQEKFYSMNSNDQLLWVLRRYFMAKKPDGTHYNNEEIRDIVEAYPHFKFPPDQDALRIIERARMRFKTELDIQALLMQRKSEEEILRIIQKKYNLDNRQIERYKQIIAQMAQEAGAKIKIKGEAQKLPSEAQEIKDTQAPKEPSPLPETAPGGVPTPQSLGLTGAQAEFFRLYTADKAPIMGELTEFARNHGLDNHNVIALHRSYNQISNKHMRIADTEKRRLGILTEFAEEIKKSIPPSPKESADNQNSPE